MVTPGEGHPGPVWGERSPALPELGLIHGTRTVTAAYRRVSAERPVMKRQRTTLQY